MEGVCRCGFWAVAWEEDAGVVVPLDERVRCVAVCADGGEADGAVAVGDVVGG